MWFYNESYKWSVGFANFMKGFVLTAAFDVLEKQFNEKLVLDLMDKCGTPLGGVYSPAADYPDNTLFQLLERAAELIEMPASKLSKILGVNLFAELVLINPLWVGQAKNTFELLKSHDAQLNTAVEEAFPGFIAPSFNCIEINPDILEVNYRSPFLPACVAEGLISAAIIHYNENFYIESKKYDQPVDFNLRFFLRRRCGMRIFTH